MPTAPTTAVTCIDSSDGGSGGHATFYLGLMMNAYCHSDAAEQAMWFGDDISFKGDGLEMLDMNTPQMISFLLRRIGWHGSGAPATMDGLDDPSDWTARLLEQEDRPPAGGLTEDSVEPHLIPPDENVRRWQRRLDPIEVRALDGCHFTRPIVAMLIAAGFTITELDVFYQKGGPKFAGAQSLGIAVSP